MNQWGLPKGRMRAGSSSGVQECGEPPPAGYNSMGELVLPLRGLRCGLWFEAYTNRGEPVAAASRVSRRADAGCGSARRQVSEGQLCGFWAA